jgi:hypothetical protein
VRETFVSVIIDNIPIIYHFFQRMWRNVMELETFRSMSTSQKNGRANDAGEFPGHSGTGGSSDNFKKKFNGGQTLYPLSTLGGGTLSGSAKRIFSMDHVIGQGEDSSQSGKSGKTGKTGITVITETVIQDRERLDGELAKQPNHWPFSSQVRR